MNWGRIARGAVPWMVAAGILVVLLTRIPGEALRHALSTVALPAIVAVVIGYCSLGLLTDTFATWVALKEALPDSKIGLRDTLILRAASLPLAIVNFGAGQGGIVYFLKKRHGVPVSQGAGAVLLTTAAYLLVVALFVGVGLATGAVPDAPLLRAVVLANAAGIPVYLAVIATRPRLLTQWALLQPLFAAGVPGTLRVAGARVVHVLGLMTGHWLAMRTFGIDVPITDMGARMPVVFLLGALPITPSGLGTAQAAAIAMFASFAPGAAPSDRQAAVLAYSLSVQALGMLAYGGLGLAFLRRATRKP